MAGSLRRSASRERPVGSSSLRLASSAARRSASNDPPSRNPFFRSPPVKAAPAPAQPGFASPPPTSQSLRRAPAPAAQSPTLRQPVRATFDPSSPVRRPLRAEAQWGRARGTSPFRVSDSAPAAAAAAPPSAPAALSASLRRKGPRPSTAAAPPPVPVRPRAATITRSASANPTPLERTGSRRAPGAAAGSGLASSGQARAAYPPLAPLSRAKSDLHAAFLNGYQIEHADEFDSKYPPARARTRLLAAARSAFAASGQRERSRLSSVARSADVGISPPAAPEPPPSPPSCAPPTVSPPEVPVELGASAVSAVTPPADVTPPTEPEPAPPIQPAQPVQPSAPTSGSVSTVQAVVASPPEPEKSSSVKPKPKLAPSECVTVPQKGYLPPRGQKPITSPSAPPAGARGQGRGFVPDVPMTVSGSEGSSANNSFAKHSTSPQPLTSLAPLDVRGADSEDGYPVQRHSSLRSVGAQSMGTVLLDCDRSPTHHQTPAQVPVLTLPYQRPAVETLERRQQQAISADNFRRAEELQKMMEAQPDFGLEEQTLNSGRNRPEHTTPEVVPKLPLRKLTVDKLERLKEQAVRAEDWGEAAKLKRQLEAAKRE